MKPRQLRNHVVVSLCAALVLASGCAKQPAPEAATTPPPAVQEPVAVAPTTPPPALSEETVTEAAPATAVTTTQATAQQTAAEALSALTRINFDYDQHLLTTQAQEMLAANAAILKANPDVKVRIEGHCDERGSDQYNIALGERRAKAAKDYLVTLGVPATQMGTVSFGEEKPLDPGHAEAAWVKNRRAEFVPAP